MSIQASDEIIQKVIDEKVDELIYADNEATSITYAKVQEGTVPSGYVGVIMGVAVSSVKTLIMYIERDEKQYYENGLNCGGMSHVPEAGTDQLGVGNEIPLLIRIKEKGKWALGFKATAATPSVSWRLRIRHYKIG